MVTSRTAQSVLVFGTYMILQGLTLLLVPNLLLGLLGLPFETSVWPRAVGWALIALGYYYVRNALANNHDFFGWTVQVRSAQFLVFIGFVIFKLASPILLATSGLEFLAGIWTWIELRQNQSRTD
jgi:zinc transporter ZupT